MHESASLCLPFYMHTIYEQCSTYLMSNACAQWNQLIYVVMGFDYHMGNVNGCD